MTLPISASGRRHTGPWRAAIAHLPSLLPVALLVAGPMTIGDAGAQPPATGRQVYESACAACHGTDGRGGTAAASAYPLVPPDFTDCSFATREPDGDWLAVSHAGGPARGFDRLMPAFGEALGREDLERALAYVRAFCADAAWPRGELNLPRALVTTKAYPEDEAVLTVIAQDGALTNQFVYERRIGPRNQVEFVVPLMFAERNAGDWTGGVGDIAIAFKRALAHSLRRGSIFSAAVELVTPTGSTERGIGSGTTVVEPFVAFGQLLPAAAFVQLQLGAGVPFDRDHHDEVFWRGVVGREFTQGEFGRAWSPMLEVLGAHELGSGLSTEWDVVPQVQVTLSTRQHIMANLGVRVPVNERTGRSTRFMAYLLWDWFDGGFLDGW
jgi:mono/diheme cytochrome c family protein